MRKLKSLIYAWISEKYMHGCSNYNSLQVRRGCRSKAQARAIFARHNVPHARGMVFIWPWTAGKFAKEHEYPLVIKPNVSGYSRGSYFPINNKKELYRAIFWAKAWWPTTIIEQYLRGSNYRILTTPDELVSVIQRYPPFVIGNARDTVSRLIDAENEVRTEMQLHPTIFPIEKSRKILRHLRSQGLTLDSVPSENQRVELFHRVALAPGGVVETINQDTVAEANKQLFYRIVDMFGANILGIDVIFEKGIEIPYTQQHCIFIEVNSRPYIKMHHYPRYGEKEDFSGKLTELDNLLIEDRDIF